MSDKFIAAAALPAVNEKETPAATVINASPVEYHHFGRPLGFASGTLLISLANVLYASCNKVEIFLSGGIFEALGDSWWNITQQIFNADITSFLNRGIFFTLPESPSAIPTLYAGSYLGEHMLLNSSWRWGYGMWAVILHFCALPTTPLMAWMDPRAKKRGIIEERVSLLHDAPSGASWSRKDGKGEKYYSGMCGAYTIATSDAVYRTFLSIFLQVTGLYAPGNATRIDNTQRVAYNVGALLAGVILKYGKKTKPLIALGFVMIVLANGLPFYLTNMNVSVEQFGTASFQGN
ncbi:uncharacterized protein RCO7_07866 [Rhynchosporium graminicola]|uniref:Uncharacterized protein n=1 Tax=Rhynchosporium graminicola TaxID=2792576 RepID=A0A1E1KN88_9HELO|nr:uncharacterized protein RCO7_07866 [Rhynchosporium commune]